MVFMMEEDRRRTRYVSFSRAGTFINFLGIFLTFSIEFFHANGIDDSPILTSQQVFLYEYRTKSSS